MLGHVSDTWPELNPGEDLVAAAESDSKSWPKMTGWAGGDFNGVTVSVSFSSEARLEPYVRSVPPIAPAKAWAAALAKCPPPPRAAPKGKQAREPWGTTALHAGDLVATSGPALTSWL